jgi:hypothetical protein
MKDLSEIEAAIGTLSVEDQQALLLFLAERLRGQRQGKPAPRLYASEQIDGWIAEDEAEMRRFREGK